MLKELKGKILLKILNKASMYFRSGNLEDASKGFKLLKYAYYFMDVGQAKYLSKQLIDLAKELELKD